MQRMIFVNLSVADLEASIAFYESLGFTKTPKFSDDAGACMGAATASAMACGPCDQTEV